MKRLVIYFVLFFLALFYSCNKKKYPETIIEDARSVFNFIGTIDGKPVSIKAGIDDYYMYSSYTHDSNGVYNFIGELKPTECVNCVNTLKIQINDFKISLPNESTNVDSSLVVKSYNILSGINSYQVAFQSLFNKQAQNYYWDFGDGITSTEANPVHVFEKAGQYNVSLKIKSVNDCESFIANTQNIDVSNNTFKTSIGVANLSGNSVSFTQNTSGGKTPYKYLWRFGDGDTASSASPIHSYLISGSYPVSLKTTDANGATTTANYNVVTQNDVSSCASNYNIQYIKKIANPNVSLSKIIVTWTDANGVVYTSNKETQPNASYFDLTEVENYDVNENHQSTKKLKVKFKCMVYNGNKSILIDNAEAVIAVAYK